MIDILDGYNVIESFPPPFTGATGNTRGDKDGTMASTKIFDVFGDVKVIVIGRCKTTLAGAGSIEVGITGNTALVIAQCADATTIAAGDLYVDTSVAEAGGFVATALPAATYIFNGNDIYEKVAGTDVSAGQMSYVCLWTPITEGSKVVPSYPNANQ
jgi:hypothetical protein